jgi:hypothetical protein
MVKPGESGAVSRRPSYITYSAKPYLEITSRARRMEEIASFAIEQLVPLIVEHCQDKLATLLNHRGTQFEKCWQKIKPQASQDELGILEEYLDQICQYLKAASDGDKDARLSFLVSIVYLAAAVTKDKRSVAIDAIWTRILEGGDATSRCRLLCQGDSTTDGIR